MNQKGFANIVVIGAIIILLGIVGYFVAQNISSSQKDTSNGGGSGIFGTVSLGPQCPGPARPEMVEECVDQPYQGTFIVVTQNRERQIERQIASFQSNSKGEFRVSMPPGEYIIVSSDSQPSLFCRAFVKVEPDKFTEVKVRCDTGVR